MMEFSLFLTPEENSADPHCGAMFLELGSKVIPALYPVIFSSHAVFDLRRHKYLTLCTITVPFLFTAQGALPSFVILYTKIVQTYFTCLL